MRNVQNNAGRGLARVIIAGGTVALVGFAYLTWSARSDVHYEVEPGFASKETVNLSDITNHNNRRELYLVDKASGQRLPVYAHEAGIAVGSDEYRYGSVPLEKRAAWAAGEIDQYDINTQLDVLDTIIEKMKKAYGGENELTQ